MFDFGGLGKKLEEVLADVNPFDHGATGATVRANRTKQPVAQTRRAVPASQQRPTTQFKPTQLKSLSLPSITASQASLRPKQPTAPAKPNTPLDVIGEAAQGIGKVVKPVVDGLVDTGVKVANTGAVLPALAAGALTGNKDVQSFANDTLNRSYIPRSVATGQASPLDFAKSFTNAGVDASNIIPTKSAITGLANGLSRAGVVKSLVSNVKQAGVYGTANTANDALQGRQVTPQSALLNYGAPAALGAGAEIAGGALRSGANAYANAADAVVNRPMPAAPQSRLLSEGGYARLSKSTGPDGQQVIKPYVSGTKAQSPEYQVPVSTHETRRQPIKVTQPRAKAQKFIAVQTHDGKDTFEFIPFDGRRHKLKNGMVVDRQGKTVGSYLKIDESGNIEAYLEGKPENMNHHLGDLNKWGNKANPFIDINRHIDTNAPDARTARKTQEFTTLHKYQQEALMKTEQAKRQSDALKVEKETLQGRPFGIKKKDVRFDIARTIEKKVDPNELRQKYGDAYYENKILPAASFLSRNFKEVRSQTNPELAKNGYKEIPEIKNYITHYQDRPTAFQRIGMGIQDLNPMGSSISSDINPGGVRGAVPETLNGLTANTGARRKYNPFAQHRKGSDTPLDAFKAYDQYLGPMLHNKYMTSSASRARLVERAFRLNEEANQKKIAEFSEIAGLQEANKMMGARLAKTHPNYKGDRRYSMVNIWQEYGNKLAGKTNIIDRAAIDSGLGGLSDFNSKLQHVTGVSTIPGSVNSMLAQVLSVPQTVSRDSWQSTLKAARDMMKYADNNDSTDPYRQSMAMRARYTDASSKRLSPVGKYTKAAGKVVPMEPVEKKISGELTWRSAYNEALKKGLKGQDAINEAEIAASKTLALRGIGDRPVAMDSKTLGLVTQFGLEQLNSGVQFFKDFTPKQKIKFLVAASAMDWIFNNVVGYSPLPDYVGAGVRSAQDMMNHNDDKKDSLGDDIRQTGQRFLGESAKFVPGASVLVNLPFAENTVKDIFGQNSDLSRFGQPAAAKLLNVGKDVVDAAVSGNAWKGLKSAVSAGPTGAQLKRSTEGVEAYSQGYQTDAQGNVQSIVDQDPLTFLQAATVGKYSLPGQKYAMDSGFELAKKDSTHFKELYKTDRQAAINFFNETIKKKVDESDRKGTLTNIGQTPVASAVSGPSNPSRPGNANVVKSTGPSVKNILDEYDNLAADEHKDWNATKNTDKSITDALTKWTGGKVPIKDITNEQAHKWAQYQKDFADGKTTKVTQDKRKRELLSTVLKSQLDDTEQTLYSMSKDKLKSYMDSGDVKQSQIDKILKVEQAQYDANLITQEVFARKLGHDDARGYKTKASGSGKKKSSKGKFDYKLFGFGSDSSKNNTALRGLLKQATVKGAGKRKKK